MRRISLVSMFVVLVAVVSVVNLACEEPTCGLRRCDIRDAECQRSTAAATACLRGQMPVAVPMRVVSQRDFLAAQMAIMHPVEEEREFQRWARGLALLALAPEGLTLGEASQSSNAQIAAFYLDLKQGITIVDSGSPLDSIHAVALLVHEYAHALQDHEIDLVAYFGRHANTFDRALASGAVIEGDATHVQDLALLGLFGTDVSGVSWREVFGQWQEWARRRAARSTVPVTLAWAHFRYPFGAELAATAALEGGRPAVRGLFDAPPVSTRQVLANAGGKMVQEEVWLEELGPEAVPVLPEFMLFGADHLGAWILEVFLQRVASAELAQQAGAQLRGDTFSLHVQTNAGGERVAVAWRMRFASEQTVGLVATALSQSALRLSASASGRDLIIMAATDGASIPTPVAWQAIPNEGVQPIAASVASRRVVCAPRAPND